jgi:hypothetical protein
MSEIDCEGVRLAAMARRDGEPAGLPESEVRAHLRTCPGCRAEVERLAALESTLAGQGLVPPAADLWGRIRSGLAGGRARGRLRRLLPLAVALLPAYRVAEAIGPVALFSAARLVPLALLLSILLILRENPLALNPALEPEGEMP